MILFIIGIVLVVYFFYSLKFNITEDMIETILRNKVGEPLVVHKILDIENKKYILFSHDAFDGMSAFDRGINGKYVLEFIDINKNNFQYVFGENFFLLGGENRNLRMSFANITYNSKEYFMEIPKQQYFVTYIPVDFDIRSVLLHSPNELRFLDDDYNDLTE